jgi:hypothetical protein
MDNALIAWAIWAGVTALELIGSDAFLCELTRQADAQTIDAVF